MIWHPPKCVCIRVELSILLIENSRNVVKRMELYGFGPSKIDEIWRIQNTRFVLSHVKATVGKFISLIFCDGEALLFKLGKMVDLLPCFPLPVNTLFKM